MNITKLLLDQFGGQIAKGLAGQVGLGEDAAKSALDSLLPTILGGMIQKSETNSGAGELFDMITKDFGGGMLDNLGGAMTQKGDNSLLNIGLKLLPMLFGGNNKSGALIDVLGKVLGVGSSQSKSMLSILAPIVLSFIGKQIAGKGLNLQGFIDMLMGQKKSVAKSLSPALMGGLGISSWNDNANEVKETVTETVREKKKSSWLWPLLGLLLLGFLLFSLLKGCNKEKKADHKIEQTQDVNQKNSNQIKRKTNANDDGSHDGHDHGSNEGQDIDTQKGQNTSNTTSSATTIPSKGLNAAALKSFEDAVSAKRVSVINFGDVSDGDGKVLTPAAQANFDKVAEIMKANPTLNLEINGHNKDHGNGVKNTSSRAASRIRAGLVQNYLKGKGVAGKRMKSSTKGHDVPLAGKPATADENKRISISLGF